MASAPSARPVRVERYDCRWSGTPTQRPSVGVLGHGVVIGRSRQLRPALRISSARPPHPPSPHGLHLRMRFPSLPQRSQKQGMSKWWNACEHPGRCKRGIKGKSPNCYRYVILPMTESKRFRSAIWAEAKLVWIMRWRENEGWNPTFKESYSYFTC